MPAKIHLVLVSLICLMCLSSVKKYSQDITIAVAAMTASAVGNSAYFHRSFAASMPMAESRLIICRLEDKSVFT
jgi:hypothetical protein